MTQEDLLRRILDELQQAGRRGGGNIGSGATTGGAGQDMEKDLRSLSTQAKDVEANIKKLNKQFLPFSGSLATAQKLHSQMSQDLDKINTALDNLEQKLDENRDGFDKMSKETKEAMRAEQTKLKAMKATVEFETQKRESVGNVFGALGNISTAYQEIARASVQGMESISSAIQQGGSGFSLLGAAAEYQAQMAQAQANMGASAMSSVGQSMQNLGIAGQVAGGALNFLAQQVQHNAELRRAAARIRNQLFMNMGEKFAQSFMAAAGAGAVFTGGATAMNAALDGSRITMAEFGELVKRNNEAFANSGMSMERLTKQVGATSAGFKKSGIDTQLMRLGLSFQEQSDIIVETASKMNKLSMQAGGAGASQEEIAKAAEQSARNTAYMANILGEEAKTREKANREASAALAYKQKENEMAQKIGAGAAANQTKVIDTALPPELRKAFNQLLQFGTITDKDTAAAVEQNPAMKKMLHELKGAYLAGNLQDAKSFGSIAGKYSKDMQASAMSNKAVANAALVSQNSTIQAGARLGSEFSTMATQFNQQTTAEAEKKTSAPKPGEAPKPKDALGDAIVDAAVTMNNMQKKMEKYVVDNLPVWSKAMTKALKDMEDAYKGAVAGLNPLADKFGWLTDFMQKYGLIVMLAAQGIGILFAMAKLASGALAKLGAAGEMAKLKALTDKKTPTVTSSKTKSGEERFYELDEAGKKKRISADRAAEIKAQSDTMEAPGGKKGKGVMSKLGGLAKLAGGALAVFNVASTAMSAYSTQQEKQAEYEEAKAKGDKKGMAEARAAQGEAVGGAVGSVAGGAIGMMLGGPIGAAVGSYLGEMAGGALGKYIGPYWDSMSEKAGQMWASTKESLSKGWDSLSSSTSELLSTLWRGITDGWNKMTTWFGKIGSYIWDGIKNSKVGQIGSLIISGITGAASGIANAMINAFKAYFDWMKTTISNIIPDWMKNAASKVGNAVTNAYNYVTGNDKPPPAAAPAPVIASKQGQVPSPGTAKPAPPAEVTLSDKQINDYAYSIFLGKNSINDVPAKYRDQISRIVKNPPASWRPASPQTPSATTGKTVPPDASRNQSAPAAKPADSKPAAPTPTGPKAPETSAKSGTVSEKDIPRLLQENLKMAEYNAKGTERMVSILASIADNAKRTATATEKSARG